MTTEEIIALEQQYGARNYQPLPVVVSRGQGASVWDPEGHHYYDFLSGIGAVSQGHCHPKIVGALMDQAQKLTLASRAFYGDNFGTFAKAASEYFGFERVLVMNTGVEAVETGIKLCRKWGYQKKKIEKGASKIIVCENNFHGRTLGAISASSPSESRDQFGPLLPGFILIPFNNRKALVEALSDPTVAGFLVEPIQGEGGVVVPDEGYLKEAARLCREANVLFVTDEVQTGIARTGMRLACDHEQVRPDILIVGKSLSGGMFPVSAILADDSVMGCFVPGDHGSTFGGNPLACAVGLAALEVVVEEKLADNAAKMGLRFREALNRWEIPWILQVRGKGLLNAIEVDPKSSVDGSLISLKLKEAGVLAKQTRSHVVRFAPPLVIQERQMDEALDRMREVFMAL